MIYLRARVKPGDQYPKCPLGDYCKDANGKNAEVPFDGLYAGHIEPDKDKRRLDVDNGRACQSLHQ